MLKTAFRKCVNGYAVRKAIGIFGQSLDRKRRKNFGGNIRRRQRIYRKKNSARKNILRKQTVVANSERRENIS